MLLHSRLPLLLHQSIVSGYLLSLVVSLFLNAKNKEM